RRASHRPGRPAGLFLGRNWEYPSLEHRAPDGDVIQLDRFYSKWILIEDREIGDFAGADTAEFVLLLPRIRRLDGDSSEGVLHADAFLGARHAARRRDAVDSAPHEIKWVARSHRQVGVKGEWNMVL